MRYLGGKSKIAHDIASLINRHDERCVYLEPFMGSCWVTCQITLPIRYVGDLHDEVVELYYQLTHDLWDPPHTLSKEEFEDIREHRATGKYPKPLVAFAGFGCAYAGSYWRSYAGQKLVAGARRSLLKKKEFLRNCTFFSGDYRDLNPVGCVIYCDPPYAGAKYGYRITGVRGNGKFDNDEFWRVMGKWSERNVVYVSEYEAPKGWQCIWEKPVTRGVRTERGNEKKIERVFAAGNEESLMLCDEDNRRSISHLGIDCEKVSVKDRHR